MTPKIQPEPEKGDCLELENLALRFELAKQQFQIAGGQLQEQMKHLRDRIFEKGGLSRDEWNIDVQAKRFVKK
jgi:hypothetical protein